MGEVDVLSACISKVDVVHETAGLGRSTSMDRFKIGPLHAIPRNLTLQGEASNADEAPILDTCLSDRPLTP
jgi:hypothetical protein